MERNNRCRQARNWMIAGVLACFLLPISATAETVPLAAEAWPPPLPGANNGTVTITTPDFLKVPESVEAARSAVGAADFIVAKTPPVVELAYLSNLPNRADNGTGWSAWGDIEVASDGKVYVGIGNHGRNNQLPQNEGGYAFIYCWNPQTKVLRQVVDVNEVVKPQAGDPTWSKVHAGILEGKDGKIYFTCTLNDGGRSFQTKWTEHVPGGQLFAYDPKNGQTEIIGVFPGEVTPTTRLDRERNIWYANMEGKTKGNDVALTAFDLTTRKVIYQSPRDAVVASRNLALARVGAV
jgi:hypothetical protein